MSGAPPRSWSVRERGWFLTASAALGCCAGCAPIDDGVFEIVGFELSPEPLRFAENTGLARVPIALTRAPDRPISLTYRAVELTAQNGCQAPDFRAVAGTLVWPAGERVANVELWIEDDLLAETDEQLKLVFEDPVGALLPHAPELILEISDDDRTALIDAHESFGLIPNTEADQARALQRALDAAHASGRGVVVLAPGDYEISAVAVPPGTTLSGHGARLHRPPRSAPDVQTLGIAHSGETDSLPTLVERLSIDGRREQQGPYRAYERQLAGLVALRGDPAAPGRLQVSIESLALRESTGDGVSLETNVDAKLCRLRGHDLWRDMFSVRGGGTRVRVRDVDASASAGTSGLWFDGYLPGYAGSHRIDVELEDVRLETGDVEIDVTDGSRVTVSRLVMTEAPFRLVAPTSSVSIADSVITTGIVGPVHNYWGPFSDVQLRNTTLRISETDMNGTEESPPEPIEADRALSAIQVEWTAGAAPGRLVVEGCRFERAANLEPSDSVYAVDNSAAGASVSVSSSVLAEGFETWFAPGCADCRLER